MYADSSYIDQAAQLGAKAYLSKSTSAQDLMSALRAVVQGETLLTPNANRTATPTFSKTPQLTARQREVLRLIAAGGTAQDIANQLDISVRTAELHRAAIMQRLGLHSTALLTRYAIANDLA